MQEVNSSSMSDIAFLLLVFFLVTTTISMDKGLSLILPAEGNEMEVNRKNIVNVLVNDQGKVLFDDKPTAIKDIKRKAISKPATPKLAMPDLERELEKDSHPSIAKPRTKMRISK